MYSAYPPSASQPVYSECGQRFSDPRRQNLHTPSVQRSQAAPARSPTAKPSASAPGPTSATSPTTSWPGVTPGRCGGRSPSVTCRSVRQTPQTMTLSRSSPGPGRGTSSSRLSRSGWPVTGPGVSTCHARILRTLPRPRRGPQPGRPGPRRPARAGGGGHRNSGLARLAAVGAERPAVALRVAGGEVVRAVVGVVRLGGDLGPGGPGALVHAVDIVGHHVGAERPRAGRPGGAVTDRAEHDAAARRPGQLGVVYPVAVAVDHGLLEAERVDQEPDQRAGVAGAQGRPDLRVRRC